jgi:transposase InsO family protein
MKVHDAVSVYRVGLVAVIEASPNRRAACAAAGVHPSTFYRWRKRPGGEGRRVSWLERYVGAQIVAAALGHPADGPRGVADRLAAQGVVVSASKVWRTLVKHRLNTKALRYQLLQQHRRDPEPSIQVTRRAPLFVGRLDAEVPGDLVQFDCFHVGSFKETRLGAGKATPGVIWQYTAIDVASSWLWAWLYATSHNPSPAVTSQLAHLVAADLTRHRWTWKAASTDNGNEFRAAVFQDTLHQLGVNHRFIRAGRPQSNGKVERVQRTLLEEFYQPTLINYVEPSITGLRRDLDAYLTYYNYHRAHHGRWNQGATPATIMTLNPKLHP